MKTYVYVNVAVIGSVNRVLEGLIARIRRSGLYEFCDRVFVVVNGDIGKLEVDLSGEKMSVIHHGVDVSCCEFPTLSRIFEHSLKEDFRVLYLHTKGVSRNHPFIDDWTNMLAYFNVDRWPERWNELDEYDCTGINHFGNRADLFVNPEYWGYGKTPVHYGGNFWWSTSDHIRTLFHPLAWVPDGNLYRWRMMCEMWICSSGLGKYNSAFSSGVDHYVTPFPESLYVIV